MNPVKEIAKLKKEVANIKGNVSKDILDFLGGIEILKREFKAEIKKKDRFTWLVFWLCVGNYLIWGLYLLIIFNFGVE